MFRKFIAVILLVLVVAAPANSAVARKKRKYPSSTRNIPPKISVKNLPPIILGEFYNVKIVLDDDGKVAFKASDLPQGLSFNPETGEISGTVTQAPADNIKFTAENKAGEVVREFIVRVIK